MRLQTVIMCATTIIKSEINTPIHGYYRLRYIENGIIHSSHTHFFFFPSSMLQLVSRTAQRKDNQIDPSSIDQNLF